MLKTLIKKQLLELFQSYAIDRKTGKRRGKKALVLYVLLAVLLFGMLGVVFYFVAIGLGSAILGSSFNWLFFAVGAVIMIGLQALKVYFERKKAAV